jgi:hypothetical protein
MKVKGKDRGSILQRIAKLCPCLRKLDHWEGSYRREILVRRGEEKVWAEERTARLRED